jgi:hypothetical protein
MILKKEVIDKVGYLNPKFFLSGYDTLEYSIRIKRKGFELLYVPSSIIWHIFGASAKKISLKEKTKHEIVGLVNMFKIVKWYHFPTAIIYTFFHISLLKIKAVLKLFANKEKRKKFYKTLKN